MDMRHSATAGLERAEKKRCVKVGVWQVELLPRAGYEVGYTPTQSIIGFSFDAQVGTHAFASDKKKIFHAKPNGLAFVPVGCDVYSQSTTGGEYLKVLGASVQDRQWRHERRFSDVINGVAIGAAFSLRRALLGDDTVSLLDCEHSLMALETCVASTLGESWQIDNTNRWMTAQRLRQVDEIIEARLDSQLTVSEIALEFELSSGYFSREFKKAVGRTPHQYIVDKRLGRARFLLQNPRQDLSAIAYTCGFASHSHMTEQFRVRLGITPTRLRDSLQLSFSISH